MWLAILLFGFFAAAFWAAMYLTVPWTARQGEGNDAPLTSGGVFGLVWVPMECCHCKQHVDGRYSLQLTWWRVTYPVKCLHACKAG